MGSSDRGAVIVGAPDQPDLSQYVKRSELPAGLTQVVHTQTAPMATWTIPHSLGRRPSVTVYIGNVEVMADVEATSSTVTITHASPLAGQAVLT